MAMVSVTVALMKMAKRDSKRNRGGGCGDGSGAEWVVMAAETLVASQFSAATTTISAATAWTLVNPLVPTATQKRYFSCVLHVCFRRR